MNFRHLVSTLSGAGGLELAAHSAKCMNFGCQEVDQGIFGETENFRSSCSAAGGKGFGLNADSSDEEDVEGESRG